MINATKLLIAASLCAPLVMLIPAHRADACTPPRTLEVKMDKIPELPVMHPEQIAIPLHVSGLSGNEGAPVVTVTDAAGDEHPGTLQELRDLVQQHGDALNTTDNTVFIWRPDMLLPPGDYAFAAEIPIRSLYDDVAPSSITSTFTVSADAPMRLFAAPVIDATLRAIPVGADFACCPIAKTSRGGHMDTCTGDEVAPRQSLQEPLDAHISCGYEVGSACELCIPQQYFANPTLDFELSLGDEDIPAGQLYYELKLLADGQIESSSNGNIDSSTRSFGVNDAAAQYCVHIRAINMLDGQSVTAERCIDRADMTPLPADPGAITGSDPRAVCVDHEVADMGTADMDAPDMDSADMSAADMSAADMSVPGQKTTTSGGGCATPGGASPVAPAAMLAAFGLVGWLRRRRS